MGWYHMKKCNNDCFNCPFEDCILDHVPESEAAKESQRVDGIAFDAVAKRRAYQREYYHKNAEILRVKNNNRSRANKEKYAETKWNWYKSRHPGAVRGAHRNGSVAKPFIRIAPDGSTKKYPSVKAAALDVGTSCRNIYHARKCGGNITAGGYKIGRASCRERV